MKINGMLALRNSGYKESLEEWMRLPLAIPIQKEKELEDYLRDNLHLLAPYGYELSLVKQQFVCEKMRGEIDLLCTDRRTGRYVVIELKNKRANAQAFAQIAVYMGWIKTHRADGEEVQGLVISRGVDIKYNYAVEVSTNIQQINLTDIGFE